MSNEPKRQVEIDQKIGALARTTDQIIISMRSALQREWEMEQLVQEYYVLLGALNENHWIQTTTPFWNTQRINLQARVKQLISEIEETEQEE